MRYVPLRTIAVVASVLVLRLSGDAHAQDATIYFDHISPLVGAPAAITFQQANGDVSKHMRGYPRLIEVPRGGRVCVQVQNGNPLLYNYTIKAETLKVENDSALKAFIAALQPLLPATRRIAPDPAKPPIDNYRSTLISLFQIMRAIDSLKWRSDSSSFPEELQLEQELYASARGLNGQAEKLKADPVTGPQLKAHAEYGLLAVAHDAIWARITTFHKAFADANREYARPRCVAVDTRRLKVQFTIAVREKPTDGTLLRPVSDTFTVEVEPVTTSRIEVAAGLLYGSVSDVPTFALQADSVVSRSDGSMNIWHPGIFLLLRPFESRRIWASVGVSTAKDLTKPDQFYGFVTRLGGDLQTHQVTIGIGAIQTAVPSALKVGRVGEKLPSNIPRLEDNITYNYRWGIGVMFSLSGLELKGTGEGK